MTKTVRLVTASGDKEFESFKSHDSSIRAFVFEEIVKLTDGVVDHYRSDLFHVALWIERNLHDADVFFVGIRDTGLDVDRDSDDVWVEHNPAIYKFTITGDQGRWVLDIDQVKGDEG